MLASHPNEHVTESVGGGRNLIDLQYLHDQKRSTTEVFTYITAWWPLSQTGSIIPALLFSLHIIRRCQLLYILQLHFGIVQSYFVRRQKPFTTKSNLEYADTFIALQADNLIPAVFPRATFVGRPYLVELGNITDMASRDGVYCTYAFHR